MLEICWEIYNWNAIKQKAISKQPRQHIKLRSKQKTKKSLSSKKITKQPSQTKTTTKWYVKISTTRSWSTKRPKLNLTTKLPIVRDFWMIRLIKCKAWSSRFHNWIKNWRNLTWNWGNILLPKGKTWSETSRRRTKKSMLSKCVYLIVLRIPGLLRLRPRRNLRRHMKKELAISEANLVSIASSTPTTKGLQGGTAQYRKLTKRWSILDN